MAIPTVNKFAAAMMERLTANRQKGGWGWCDRTYLLERLHQELNELTVALVDGSPPEKIRKEAADVGNFAMMIADNFGDLKREATR